MLRQHKKSYVPIPDCSQPTLRLINAEPNQANDVTVVVPNVPIFQTT
jgi:hypothetical protein